MNDPSHSSNNTAINQTSSVRLSVTDKIRELFDLSLFAVERVLSNQSSDEVVRTLEEYGQYATAYLDAELQDLRIVEIGFGARPWRVAALRALGADVWGIDLDRPMLNGGWSEMAQVRRQNGLERALKSAFRFHVLDRFEKRQIARKLSCKLDLGSVADRLIVGDASDAATWDKMGDRPVDICISEDVFEHIPAERLPPLCRIMASRMAKSSLALIRPCVFTGITGGHLAEWFAPEVDKPRRRRSAPWEHLRADRYRPNTYLNRLRLADYRNIFSEHFQIIEEVPLQKRLGAQYFANEVRKELCEYAEEELFSNNILFVLQKK